MAGGCLTQAIMKMEVRCGFRGPFYASFVDKIESADHGHMPSNSKQSDIHSLD
jgi:hypothetical protein